MQKHILAFVLSILITFPVIPAQRFHQYLVRPVINNPMKAAGIVIGILLIADYIRQKMKIAKTLASRATNAQQQQMVLQVPYTVDQCQIAVKIREKILIDCKKYLDDFICKLILKKISPEPSNARYQQFLQRKEHLDSLIITPKELDALNPLNVPKIPNGMSRGFQDYLATVRAHVEYVGNRQQEIETQVSRAICIDQRITLHDLSAIGGFYLWRKILKLRCDMNPEKIQAIHDLNQLILHAEFYTACFIRFIKNLHDDPTLIPVTQYCLTELADHVFPTYNQRKQLIQGGLQFLDPEALVDIVLDYAANRAELLGIREAGQIQDNVSGAEEERVVQKSGEHSELDSL